MHIAHTNTHTHQKLVNWIAFNCFYHQQMVDIEPDLLKSAEIICVAKIHIRFYIWYIHTAMMYDSNDIRNKMKVDKRREGKTVKEVNIKLILFCVEVVGNPCALSKLDDKLQLIPLWNLKIEYQRRKEKNVRQNV